MSHAQIAVEADSSTQPVVARVRQLPGLQHNDVVVDVRVDGQPRTYLRSQLPETTPSKRPTTRVVAEAFLASVCLVVCSPLLFLLSISVWANSTTPVLFRQQRVGQHGRLFTCFKFRTMHADADRRLEQLLLESRELRMEWARDQKLKDDPRVTPVGKFLRKTSLDELPQLFNIVRGEMAFVGPRPVVPAESLRYGGALATVLSVPPGVTGLWQVSGRNDLTYSERIALDLRYVEERSVLSDLKIVGRTLLLLARGGKGAY